MTNASKLTILQSASIAMLAAFFVFLMIHVYRYSHMSAQMEDQRKINGDMEKLLIGLPALKADLDDTEHELATTTKSMSDLKSDLDAERERTAALREDLKGAVGRLRVEGAAAP